MSVENKTVVEYFAGNYMEIRLAYMPSGFAEVEAREYIFFLIERIFGRITMTSNGYAEDGYKHFVLYLGDYIKRNPKTNMNDVRLFIDKFLSGLERDNIDYELQYQKDKR